MNKIKNVSLLDEKKNEWWILRKVESTFEPYLQGYHNSEQNEISNKSSKRESIYRTRKSELLEYSSGFRTGEETSFNKYGKRLSDNSSFKISNKRLSGGSEYGNVTKHGNSSNRNKLGKYQFLRL